MKTETHRYFTDQERYEHCRKCRLSGKTVSEYARENGINRGTLRDWMSAYKNISGKFINVNNVSEKENNIIDDEDVVVNILSEIEKKKKNCHFGRFDHSIVVIEFRDLKITTSLEQAEAILAKIYDKI
jgi:transposase-like protein